MQGKLRWRSLLLTIGLALLPGVTVEAASPALIEKMKLSVTGSRRAEREPELVRLPRGSGIARPQVPAPITHWFL